MVTTLSDSVVVTDSAPLITAEYSEILNSLHELKFSTTADSIESASILEEYYAVVRVDNQYKEFVINDIRESDESDLIKEVTASLSSVELADSLVENKITGTSASVLLRNILNGTRWTVGTVESGIYSRQFTEDVQFMTVLEAVFALQTAFNCDVNFSYVVEGSRVVSRRVNLYARLGASDGKRFEIDKDVTSLERRVDTTQLATAIYPIRREDVNGKEVITDISSLVWTTAGGKPVNKPAGQKIISDPVALQNWGRIGADGKLYDRVKLYEFNEDVSLEQMAQMSWINLGKYTSPKITYIAKVVDLYALLGSDYAHEKIVLGDDAVVIDRHFANPVITESRVTEYHRDLLDPTENEVILGFNVRDYASSRSNTSKAIQDAVDIATQARLNASSAIASANGKNTNFFGSVRPVNPRTGDLWFRPNPDNPEQQQMLYWDGVQWIIELDTATFVFPEEEIEALRQAVAEAKKAGEDAIVAGEEAKQVAEEVRDKVAQLETEVEQAVTDADSALTKANEATDKAEEARNQAFNSEQLANSAKQDAANAQAKADTAKNSADKAIVDAQKALDDLDNLDIPSKNYFSVAELQKIVPENWVVNAYVYHFKLLPNTVYTLSSNVPNSSGTNIYFNGSVTVTDGVWIDKSVSKMSNSTGDLFVAIPTGRTYTSDLLSGKYQIQLEEGYIATQWSPFPTDAQVQITQINNELSSKVSQTTFNTLEGKVNTQQTQITQNKTDITSKADKSEVDILKGTVDTQGTQINQNATAIEQRATKTEVNALTGRVSQTETTVSTQAGQITALNTKTDGNTTQIGKLQSDYTGLSSTVSKVETDLGNLDVNSINYFSTTVLKKLPVENWVVPAYVYRLTLKPNTAYTLSSNIPFNNTTTLFFNGSTTATDGVWVGKKVTKLTNSEGEIYVAIPTGRPYTNQILNGEYHVQLEKGYSQTAWVPATEDITTVSEFSSFQQTVNGFQTSVNSDISGIKSQQTQMAGQISSKVEKSEFDTLSGTVSSQQSQITQLSDSISLSVKKDGLLGEINLQAGKTLIRQGDNVLMVTPETTFIQNATIKTAAIEDAAITNAKIGELAVDTANIANLAVGTAQLKDAVITNAKIGNLAVDNAKIANGAINAVKIQDASITSAKILNLDVDKLTGNTTNFVQSSWNNLSQGVSITAAGLDFTENGTLTSTLDGNGQKFYNGSRYIGRTGVTSKSSAQSVKGVSHTLMNQGDFITWDYHASSTSPTTSPMITLDPKGLFYGTGDKGFIIDTDSFFYKTAKFKPSGGSGNIRIESDANFTKINYYYGDWLRSSLIFMSTGAIYADNIVNGTSKLLTA